MSPSTMAMSVAVWCVTFYMVESWNYESNSSFGPSYWATYFPQCNDSVQPQAPITFTASDVNMAQYYGSSKRHQIIFYRNLDASVANTNFVTHINSGGLLIARPLTPFTMIVKTVNFSQTTFEMKFLKEIAYHIGGEHQGATGSVFSMEIQYVFSDTATGPATFVYAQPIASTNDPSYTDNSIAYLLLTYVPQYASATQSGSATLNLADHTKTTLVLNMSTDEASRNPSFLYSGTVTYPPCDAVTMVVSTITGYLPLTTIQNLAAARTEQVLMTRPTQNRSLVATTLTYTGVGQGSPMDSSFHYLSTPVPTRWINVAVTRVIPNPLNKNMLAAIMALTATNAGLVIIIATLLLARYEFIDLPMWLGGLGRPVEWWTNPMSAGALDDEEEGEEEEEEDEDGDEGEHDHESAEHV